MIQKIGLFKIIVVLIGFFSSLSHADGLEIKTFDRQQAETLLNKTLFTSPSNVEAGISVEISQALEKLELHQYPSYKEIFTSTKDLGLRIKQCLDGKCDQTSDLVLELNRKVNRDAGTGFVVLPSKEGNKSISLFESFIEQNCDQYPSVKCHSATQAAIDLWDIAGAFRSASNFFNQQEKSESLSKIDLLDKQWKSYKDDTIQLWPQETLLSSIFFRQNRDGFTPPPNYKILSLRPALGMTYLSDGSPDFQPTLNMDLLGIYWWKHQDGKAKPGRGLAASLVWSGDDTAYGVTYHHGPKWSATLASSDENDVVLSISFQLGYWLLNK